MSKEVIKYDKLDFCLKCKSENDLVVHEVIAGHVTTADTTCTKCEYKDTWAVGYYLSRDDLR